MSIDNSSSAPSEPITMSVETDKTYWWCACGLSKKQPFCDGSHKGTGVGPLQYKPAQAGPTRFCVCKQTRTPPLCDRTLASCAAK